MVDPLGLGLWLTVAGFAGLVTLMVKAVLVESKLRRAQLVTCALVGAMALQSVGLIVGSFRVSSRLQHELLKSNGQDFIIESVIRGMDRLPTNALLIWFTGAVFGLSSMRLFQLFRNRAMMASLQEKLS